MQEQNPEESPTDAAAKAIDQAKDKASETMQQAREKALETADLAKNRAAEGVESAAGTVREKVGTSDGVTGKAGTKVAERMEKTAGYLREHDTRGIMQDLDRYVHEHPKRALIAALAVGFAIGRILK